MDEASSGGTNVFKSVRFPIVNACTLLLNNENKDNDDSDDEDGCSKNVVEKMDSTKNDITTTAVTLVLL